MAKTDLTNLNIAEIVPRALNILTDLVENAQSWSVRLEATRDLLDRAGFRPVDRHEIVKDKSVEELNAQLVSLFSYAKQTQLTENFFQTQSKIIVE